MSIKIVSDSSSNIFSVPGADYVAVPMKVVAEKEYLDNIDLDVLQMVGELAQHKGKSGSSCPNVQEWLDAFGDSREIFGVTISRNLSGSYNSACQAAELYMQEHPGSKVFIVDSFSAGPQMALIIDKIAELAAQGLDFDAVKSQILDYQNHTHILFCLESMMNLARNGRVNPAVAKIAGMLGIRVVGDVQKGQITPVHKPRGEKKAMQVLVEMMKERGLKEDGYVRVAHCFGEKQAAALEAAVHAEMPNVRFVVEPTTGLCSFYAEKGGLMIAMEGGFNTQNNNQLF